MQGHRRTGQQQQEIAQISRALKGLARELNTPVMALQLNRGWSKGRIRDRDGGFAGEWGH